MKNSTAFAGSIYVEASATELAALAKVQIVHVNLADLSEDDAQTLFEELTFWAECVVNTPADITFVSLGYHPIVLHRPTK